MFKYCDLCAISAPKNSSSTDNKSESETAPIVHRNLGFVPSWLHCPVTDWPTNMKYFVIVMKTAEIEAAEMNPRVLSKKGSFSPRALKRCLTVTS